MYLSIATTHAPATDLGFLLMKHPDRAHDVELSFGHGTVFFPQAEAERCEAALILDLDPVALVRGRSGAEGVADQYVNDRPYAASSFLSVALNKAFRTAMTGVSRERPELAATAICWSVSSRRSAGPWRRGVSKAPTAPRAMSSFGSRGRCASPTRSVISMC